MKKVLLIVFATVLFGLGGCATGSHFYAPPSPVGSVENSTVINRPRADVWKEAVPALGKQFFVINTIDQSSGLINLSYSGDPEKYVDCGDISTSVQNASGKHTWDFPAARAQETYEYFTGRAIVVVNRKMHLEGRVNLIFEDAGPSKTKVTANVRYVVTRTAFARNLAGFPIGSSNDTVSFNTNGSASYGSGPETITCKPTGKLEQDILSAIH